MEYTGGGGFSNYLMNRPLNIIMSTYIRNHTYIYTVDAPTNVTSEPIVYIPGYIYTDINNVGDEMRLMNA